MARWPLVADESPGRSGGGGEFNRIRFNARNHGERERGKFLDRCA